MSSETKGNNLEVDYEKSKGTHLALLSRCFRVISLLNLGEKLATQVEENEYILNGFANYPQRFVVMENELEFATIEVLPKNEVIPSGEIIVYKNNSAGCNQISDSETLSKLSNILRQILTARLNTKEVPTLSGKEIEIEQGIVSDFIAALLKIGFGLPPEKT